MTAWTPERIENRNPAVERGTDDRRDRTRGRHVEERRRGQGSQASAPAASVANQARVEHAERAAGAEPVERAASREGDERDRGSGQAEGAAAAACRGQFSVQVAHRAPGRAGLPLLRRARAARQTLLPGALQQGLRGRQAALRRRLIRVSHLATLRGGLLRLGRGGEPLESRRPCGPATSAPTCESRRPG